MNCSSSRMGRAVAVAAMAVSVLYPVAVYLGLRHVPPLVMVAVALSVIGARLLTLGTETARLWRAPLLFTAAGLAALGMVDGALAALAYPVLLSLGMAGLFGRSLLRPPSLVERFARLSDPAFPPEAVGYCRTVTVVWTVFLVANAAVAAGLALWGSPEAWTLWTGLVAYLLMGTLFAGEYAVRRLVRRRRCAS